MYITETELNDELLDTLIALSENWQNENISYGYRKNTRADIEGMRLFLAKEKDEIRGYLFGKIHVAQKTDPIIEAHTCYFELEELYVIPAYRSQGIGKSLYNHVEQVLTEEGIPAIFLGTATKDVKRILHFYLDECGMEFWSARLFKRLPAKMQQKD